MRDKWPSHREPENILAGASINPVLVRVTIIHSHYAIRWLTLFQQTNFPLLGGGSDSTVPADYGDHNEDFRHNNNYHNIYNIHNATLTESVLPWKRNNDASPEANQVFPQQEFPAWIDNNEYTSHRSPTATYLDGISREPNRLPVMQLFDGAFDNLDSSKSSNMEGQSNPAFNNDEGLEMNSIKETGQSPADSSTSEHLTYL